MERKTKISLMIVLLMVISSFSVAIADTSPPYEPGIVTFEKTIWNEENQSWVPSLYGVIIGDTVHFKLTITYAIAGYSEGVKLSLKKINIFDNLPYGLEYVDCNSTVDGTPIVPEISGITLHWNLTDASYNLDENENHIIEFSALVVYSENVNYTEPETKIDNHAYATAWECGHIYYHEEHDYAYIYVDVTNKIEVNKEVWNGNEWTDSVNSVILGQTLTFKITITYYGLYVIDSMTVIDYLPDCLTYANNAIITGAENVIPTVEEGKVTWYWAKDLNLGNGGTVTITFDTKVVKYCEEEYDGEVNSVSVHAESFCHGSYWGYAEIPVNCIPPNPIFEKAVWNGEQWVEKANVYVNDTIKYKIDLTYYGKYNLTDIEIMDELPCVLEHVDEKATLTVLHNNTGHTESIATDISENKKIAWWNLTDELEDGTTLSIVFNVLVTGRTGDCGTCGINTASYTGYSNGNDYSGSDTAQISSTYKPPTPPAMLTISVKRFSIGHTQVSVKNTGETELSFVKWNISVNGGIRGRINANADGTIEELESGSTVSISTGRGSIKRAFGKITVTVTVFVGDEKFVESYKGFALGRLVRLKPAA